MNCPKCGGPGTMGLIKFYCDACEAKATPEAPPDLRGGANPVARAVKDGYDQIQDEFTGEDVDPRWFSWDLSKTLLVNPTTYACMAEDAAAMETAEPFRPEDWDVCSEHCAYEHHETGERISFGEMIKHMAPLSIEEIKRVQDVRDQRANSKALKVAHDYLRQIAEVVGVDGTYHLSEVVERVKDLKRSTEKVTFYGVEGCLELTPMDAKGQPVTPDYLADVRRFSTPRYAAGCADPHCKCQYHE